MLKGFAVVIAVAFVLFYIVSYPDRAADFTNGTWDHTQNIAHGVGTFLNKLHS